MKKSILFAFLILVSVIAYSQNTIDLLSFNKTSPLGDKDFLIEKFKNTNNLPRILILPIDNMLCLVPEIDLIGKIPNACPNKINSLFIPNAYPNKITSLFIPNPLQKLKLVEK